MHGSFLLSPPTHTQSTSPLSTPRDIPDDEEAPDVLSGMLPGVPSDAAARPPPAETDVSRTTVCIDGGKPGHALTKALPATPTYPPKAPPMVEKELTLSSAELDGRIQHHLETRATEWSVCSNCDKK